MPDEKESVEEEVVADKAADGAEEVSAVEAKEEPAAAAPSEGAAKEGAPAEEKKEGAPGEEKKDDGKAKTAEEIFLELEGEDGVEKPKILKAKSSKNVHTGIVHVSATFNNTIVTVSDLKGNVIGWSSSATATARTKMSTPLSGSSLPTNRTIGPSSKRRCARAAAW